MRRLTIVTVLTAVIAVGSALPALAAEADDSSLIGNAQGALVALVLGVALGTFFVIQAYRDPRFGVDEAQHEQAHDVREGFDDHTASAPEPDVDDMPSGDLP